jgi:minor extracellular protease Epr
MRYFSLALAAALPGAALAQLGLPPLGGVMPPLDRALSRVADLPVPAIARDLVRLRTERLTDLLARFPRELERDPQGNPAVRGEVLLTGAGEAVVRAAETAGYRLIGREMIEGTDVAVARIAVPQGQSLARAVKRLRKLAPDAEVSANPLYFASGNAGGAGGAALAPDDNRSSAIGMIDGGVAALPGLSVAEQRGFAAGAPAPSAHGTAVASLIAGAGRVRGAAPGAPLLAADVYGRDPKGGNALAIARALGWITQRGARVVTVSLVGPPNPLIAATVGAVQRKGVIIVAAVGNDGPAAPPAYPASYPGVVAVTGVDGRNRPLIEAGRATHLDFAAPGAANDVPHPSGARYVVCGAFGCGQPVARRIDSSACRPSAGSRAERSG